LSKFGLVNKYHCSICDRACTDGSAMSLESRQDMKVSLVQYAAEQWLHQDPILNGIPCAMLLVAPDVFGDMLEHVDVSAGTGTQPNTRTSEVYKQHELHLPPRRCQYSDFSSIAILYEVGTARSPAMLS
jgi:hypothetical protein